MSTSSTTSRTDQLARDINVFFFGENSIDAYAYDWKINETAKSRFGALPGVDFSFDVPRDPKKSNIDLRFQLSSAWASANHAERRNIAHWVVKEWGGIKGNKDETIESYLLPMREYPLKGIASYSKILSVIDPKLFAIYDARVAACLNVIQLQIPSSAKLYFPIPQGRNSLIAGTSKKKGAVDILGKDQLRDRGFESLNSTSVYTTYLDLISAISTSQRKQLIEIEMYLFSMGPAFCAKLLKSL